MWSEEAAVIRAMEEARGGAAKPGISVLWWGIACVVSAMGWVAILAAFG
jgi:hypothetical protein